MRLADAWIAGVSTLKRTERHFPSWQRERESRRGQRTEQPKRPDHVPRRGRSAAKQGRGRRGGGQDQRRFDDRVEHE